MTEKVFYHSIYFPGNDGSSEEDGEKNAFEVINKSEAEDLKPVIVLLGWAGCKEKHLQKYCPMYEKKGYIILQLRVPTQLLFFQSNKAVDVAEGLLSILAENNLTNNPIIIHVFSNGGSMVYARLTTLLHSPGFDIKQKLYICGVIFDSTPGKPRPLNAVKAFMSSLQFGFLIRYMLGICLLLYLVSAHILRQWMPFELGAGTGFQVYDLICKDALQCPQLFLYSKADKVILAEDVMEVIATRKERGIVVKSICWDDSAHVSHMRVHPEVYSKACTDFVEACLAPRQAKL